MLVGTSGLCKHHLYAWHSFHIFRELVNHLGNDLVGASHGFLLWPNLEFYKVYGFWKLGVGGKELSLELEPILVTMKEVENIVVDVDQIQLNKQLCKYLGKKIVKTRITLEVFVSMSTSITIDQNRAFQEIHMLVKHAKV